MSGEIAANAGRRTRSVRRRRFLIASIAALAALGVSMGVSFLGDTGTASISLSTPLSNSFVYPVSSAGSAPPGFDGTTNSGLRYGTTATGGTTTPTVTDATFGTGSSLVNPTWTPSPSTAGSVTGAGDLALIDATSTTLPSGGSVLVSIYITNLSTLSDAYSSFALPLEIFQCASTCQTETDTSTADAGNWKNYTTATPLNGTSPTVFLTSNTGYISFSLPEGYYYDITIPQGGSFYALSGVSSSNDAPTYYITAQSS